MAVRFLHTADWQIGMNARHTGAASPRVREARFRTAERLAEIARQQQVDFAVLAGDTFEHHAVALAEVERTADILGRFPCPVLVLPGNHDPLEAGSVWERPVWKAFNNIRILGEACPLEMGEAVLFPCPLRSRWSADDPTAWIPAGSGAGRIRIGIAHGTVEGVPAADRAHPVPADAAWARRLDYLALGDWHSLQVFGDAQRGFRMAYSGTPEPTSFGEKASGRALIVEIDAPGAPPRLHEVETAQLVWRRIEREIRQPGELRAVREETERLAGPNVLLEVKLKGALAPEDEAVLDSLGGLAGQFLLFRIEHSELLPCLRLEDLPEGPLKEAAQRLEQKTKEAETASAARLALRTLLRLARGAGA